MTNYPTDVAIQLKLQSVEKEEKYYYETRTFMPDGVIIFNSQTVQSIFCEYDVPARTAFILAKLLILGKISNLDKVQKRREYV